MADVTDPQAVRFCNERVRPAADRFAQLYYWCVSLRDEWTAQDIAGLIPNSTDVVLDGSATDGRPIITGADVHAVKDRVVEFLDNLDADTAAKLNEILAVSVNPTR